MKEKIKPPLIIVKDIDVNINWFVGISILQLSEILSMPCSTLMRIIKQKNGWIDAISNDYILEEKDLLPLSDFLQAAYNAKLRKDKQQRIFKSDVEYYNRKWVAEKTKPSLGEEGDYRKLIYIPTKT